MERAEPLDDHAGNDCGFQYYVSEKYRKLSGLPALRTGNVQLYDQQHKSGNAFDSEQRSATEKDLCAEVHFHSVEGDKLSGGFCSVPGGFGAGNVLYWGTSDKVPAPCAAGIAPALHFLHWSRAFFSTVCGLFPGHPVHLQCDYNSMAVSDSDLLSHRRDPCPAFATHQDV